MILEIINYILLKSAQAFHKTLAPNDLHRQTRSETWTCSYEALSFHAPRVCTARTRNIEMFQDIIISSFVTLLLGIGAQAYLWLRCLNAPEVPGIPHGYTRVHGVLIKLDELTHPGGLDLLALANGADATHLFDAYHWRAGARERAWALATKGKGIALPPLSPVHNDWYNELRAFAKAQKHDLTMPISQAFYALLFIMMQIYSIRAFIRLEPFGALWGCLAMLTGFRLSHDGSHASVSRRPFVNAAAAVVTSPWIYCPGFWLYNHVSMHHSYTNSEKDPDHSHLELINWFDHAKDMKDMKTKRCRLHTARLAFGMFCFTVLTFFPTPFMAIYHARRSRAFRAVLERFAIRDSLHYALLFWCWSWPVYWAPGASIKVATMLLVPNIVLPSLYFFAVTQVNHLHEQCKPSTTVDCWFAEQVKTSQDFAVTSWLSSFVTGGLNCQSVHHVAPNVHNSWLPLLRPRLMDVLGRHDIAKNEPFESWTDAFQSTQKLLTMANT